MQVTGSTHKRFQLTIDYFIIFYLQYKNLLGLHALPWEQTDKVTWNLIGSQSQMSLVAVQELKANFLAWVGVSQQVQGSATEGCTFAITLRHLQTSYLLKVFYFSLNMPNTATYSPCFSPILFSSWLIFSGHTSVPQWPS